jgi:Ca-activated chloride channel family protein
MRPARVAFAVLVAVSALAAQEPAGELRITSPRDTDYVSGLVTLRAVIEPAAAAAAARKVTFYVDGRVACEAATPSAISCTWDAGPGVKARTIRAVADLEGRPRLVAVVHTKALGYAERVSVRAVQVNAVVTEHGKFVRGLPREAFELAEDDVRQRIDVFQPDSTAPLELVVALDVSGSMSPFLPQLKTAVKTFLSAISPRDRVTLVAFNDSLYAIARRESDPAARTRAVDRITAWGGTSLYDVIIKSFDQVARVPGRHAVLVFTDGEDRTSLSSLEAVEARVRASDATMYTVGLGRGSKVDALKAVLERLAEATGGRTIFAERLDKLDQSFAEILEELSNQYLFAYEPTNSKRDGAWRRITLRTRDPRYKVRARQGYTAEKQ